MDLSIVDPAVIEARGQYATVNGEYKSLMSAMQSNAQQACDALRRGLNEADVAVAQQMFADAESLSGRLREKVALAAELKKQKDELWPIAWGK